MPYSRAFDHAAARDGARLGYTVYSDAAPGLWGPTTSIVGTDQPSRSGPLGVHVEPGPEQQHGPDAYDTSSTSVSGPCTPSSSEGAAAGFRCAS